MQTLLLQAEIQEINLPIVEEFLKKIKAKKVKIKSIETLKEVVEKGRKDYKEGKILLMYGRAFRRGTTIYYPCL